MIRSKVWWLRLGLVALLLGACVGPAFAQCEMCKTGLSKSPEGARLVDGFRSGILLLMALPYVLVGTSGLVGFVIYRRRRAQTAAAPDSAPGGEAPDGRVLPD